MTKSNDLNRIAAALEKLVFMQLFMTEKIIVSELPSDRQIEILRKSIKHLNENVKNANT